jgi:steroid 5-alpha reductase family enzyme
MFHVLTPNKTSTLLLGYGMSVATMSLALLYAFVFQDGNINISAIKASVPAILVINTLAYGLRLASFIYMREQTVQSKKKIFKDLDKTERLKRIPLAMSVSLLYAFMTSPALFALRGTVAEGSALAKIQLVSAGVSVFGTLLEAVADQHKYLVKRGKDESDVFAGPTTWSYRLCRHPNYLGEILVWIGVFAGGSVSFGKSIVAWICGALGLWGILGIMFNASSRLDKKQEEKYGKQNAYIEWKKQVSFPIVPFVSSEPSLGPMK